MSGLGLVGLPARRFRTTTDSNDTKPIAPNVLNRDFVATRPNEKWVTDITYVWTAEGWRPGPGEPALVKAWLA